MSLKYDALSGSPIYNSNSSINKCINIVSKDKQKRTKRNLLFPGLKVFRPKIKALTVSYVWKKGGRLFSISSVTLISGSNVFWKIVGSVAKIFIKINFYNRKCEEYKKAFKSN